MASWGKIATGLRVVNDEGQAISSRQAIIRSAAIGAPYAFCLLFFLVFPNLENTLGTAALLLLIGIYLAYFLISLLSPGNRALHEILSKTRVVRHAEDAVPDTTTASSGISTANDEAVPAFATKSLLPVAVCCLGFGWVVTFILPPRFYLADGLLGNLIPIALLAIPAVTISVLGLLAFIRPPKVEWSKALGVLAFTMVIATLVLGVFHFIAERSLVLENRYYGRASGFVYAAKLIGWSGHNHESASLLKRLLASILHTGFCEEITKLFPLLIYAWLTRKKPDRPPLKDFLLLGMFSGLGFGMIEALRFYAPWTEVRSVQMNVIRWFACVPLHAVYAMVDAAFLWLLLPSFKKAKTTSEAIGILVVAVLAIAVLHGVYNTFAGMSPIMGLILDGLAIFMLALIVRYCARVETANPAPDHIYVSLLPLPKWLIHRPDNRPYFGRIYAVAGGMLLSALLFANEAPKLSVADRIHYEFGVKLDQESAIIYSMGYSLGSQANRPTSMAQFEQIVSEAFSKNPDANPALAKLMMAGLEDGYNSLPSRLNAINYDDLNPPSSGSTFREVEAAEPTPRYRPQYSQPAPHSTGSLRSEVRALLEIRYRDRPDLRGEIESGVMELAEVYPELSASELVRKFEAIATGSGY